MSNAIAGGRVVTIHYTLTDAEGEVIDTSSGRDPLAYLHGHGNIVPGLEQALEGREVGDAFQVVVSPADGYGVRDPSRQHVLPRSVLPADADIQVGMMVTVQEQDGSVTPYWIAGFDDEHLAIDGNHPLAGVELHFDVRVEGVRDATPEELAHGHPHGPGGHDH